MHLLILLFYKKNNVDNNCPCDNLEQDIYSLKNEGNILLLGDFNARTVTKQTTVLSIDSNYNHLWLGTKEALKT